MGSYYDPVLIKDKRQQLVELSSYTNRRCRCDICKKAHNVYMKMYKKAHSVR